MTALTTHVLNISNGKPANNLHIELVFYQGTKKIKLGNFITNKDGRIDQPILSGKNFKIGTYKIIFNVKDYLLKNKFYTGSSAQILKIRDKRYVKPNAFNSINQKNYGRLTGLFFIEWIEICQIFDVAEILR